MIAGQGPPTSHADLEASFDPMIATIETVLFLLSVLVIVAIAAPRLNIAPSILLVIAGVGMALIPGLPRIELAPELVLFGFLPPLIYSAGVSMSWREFCFNLRPIVLLAVGCVIFTAFAVAVAVNWLLGMPFAVAFLLGAIVAPPDVVAPLAIARRLGLPRRLLVVLEGEGLANDATALILYRFAIAAISTGLFSLPEAGGTFVLIVVGEIAFGIAVGWASLRLRRWAHDPRVEITLSLMTPYVAFWVPEQLGGSGVLATVAAGLFVSWRGPLLIPALTRLQGIFFWDLVIYFLEGFIFLLTGLEVRAVLERVSAFPLAELVAAALATVAVVIAARFIWVFPATYLPRWLIPPLARRDPSPPWQQVFLLSFIGVRGVVSLAAALAIPFSTVTGEPFPFRDQIFFITFGVILVTLVGQGIVLPSVVRWLGLGRTRADEHLQEHEAELAARWEALRIAGDHLDRLAAENEAEDVLSTLRAHHDYRVRRLPRTISDGVESATRTSELRLQLINNEREYLYDQLRQGRITDEARRRLERELDLEEAIILNRRGGADAGPL
jgi:CPA1 family monovalent cation:H+ antiporter